MIKNILFPLQMKGKTVVNVIKQFLHENDDLEEIDSAEYLNYVTFTTKK